MTELEECPHGLGDPAWCSTCKHGPTRPAVVTHGAPFVSRYAGSVCRECRAIIDAGERIAARLVDGNPVGYVHEECAR